MADEQENTVEQQESVENINVDSSEVDFVWRVQEKGLNEEIVTSRSESCTLQKVNLKRIIKSEGGDPNIWVR